MKNTKFNFGVKLCLILIMVLGFCSIMLAQEVSAESFWKQQIGMGTGDKEIGGVYGETGTPTDVRLTVAKIINIFLGLLGIIFLGLIIYAGFTWMTASGDETKIGKAKATLLAGIIGLIIILSSYAISVFITDKIISATTKIT